MKKITLATLIAASMSPMVVTAQDLSITVTNLTHGMAFTNPIVAAHNSSNNLFMVGTAASTSLQAMAEGGDIAGLQTDLDTITATRTNGGGPLMAGTSVTVTLNTDTAPANTNLSAVAMLLPTNDAFMGLNSIEIPTAAGTYTYYLNAYDSGTEANDELFVGMPGGAPGVAGIPGDPGGMVNTGGTVGVSGVDSNTNVHIHRGAIGDSNATGGNSDLDNTIHRWLNPVARVTVVVN